RTLAAGLAARLDFTMDDIEDLRIAVSEASASSSTIAAAQSPEAPDYESFGWQVLATLADEAAIDAVAGRYSVRLLVRSSLAS
ncbi:MAG TPA: anti-sigma factor, partial [Nocardioides sp.]|nr:anti-sigma factor [Nocardioides sp.]